MNTERTNVGTSFLVQWVLTSIVGFAIGAWMGFGVAYSQFDRVGFDATMGITAGLMMGAIGGCLQWLVLREKVARAGPWVLASALGLAVTLGTLGAISIFENYVLTMVGILFAVVFGITGGVLQSLVLRRAGIPRAGLWVLASLCGSLVAVIGFPISSAIGENALSLIVFGLLLGAGLGAIPGVMLVWLLRHSPSSDIEDLAMAH